MASPSPPPARLEPSDFDLENGQPLGCGAFAQVTRCQHRHTQRHYAIKILSKVQLLHMKKVEGAMAEKKALYALGPHVGIAYLHGTMQTEDELFFVFDLIPNGDLLEHIRRVAGKRRMAGDDLSVTAPRPCLSMKDTRTIAAQLVLVLAHVASRGYVLRDLKPENIVFDADGRCVLIDFDAAMHQPDGPKLPTEASAPPAPSPRNTDGGEEGAAAASKPPTIKVSQIQEIRRNTSTFAGTAHYVAPEALDANTYSFASDLFALGVIVFHMLTGKPLFNGASSFFVMKEIKRGVASVTMPPAVARYPEAEAFIRSLCCAEPTARLGVHPDTRGFDLDALKAHPFFNGVDWATVAYPPVAPRAALDPPPSAQRRPPFPTYDETPFHTDEYAAYVYQTGDSMFERFAEQQEAKRTGANADQEAEVAEAETVPKEGNASASHRQSTEPTTTDEEEADEEAEDDDDRISVEDDVGVANREAGGERFAWGGS